MVSNASAFRAVEDVPLLIPEVNASHLGMIARQRANRQWSGLIVTSPNCTITGVVMALKPLHEVYGVQKVFMASMQAVSGAGYPGVASLDILDNVIPYIPGEEEKFPQELGKMLGSCRGGRVHLCGPGAQCACQPRAGSGRAHRQPVRGLSCETCGRRSAGCDARLPGCCRCARSCPPRRRVRW